MLTMTMTLLLCSVACIVVALPGALLENQGTPLPRWYLLTLLALRWSTLTLMAVWAAGTLAS